MSKNTFFTEPLRVYAFVNIDMSHSVVLKKFMFEGSLVSLKLVSRNQVRQRQVNKCQLTFICSKSTTETLKKGAKYVES